jgi:hypothetical protein
VGEGLKIPWNCIFWWEKRRFYFNALLLVAGIVSIGVLELVGGRLVQPGEDIEEPLGLVIGAIAFGVGANICYSLGWITELLWSWGDVSKTEALRPRIFSIGVWFSVALTFLPAAACLFVWTLSGFR